MLELACFLKFRTNLPDDITLLDDKSIRLPHKIVTIDNVEQIILDR